VNNHEDGAHLPAVPRARHTAERLVERVDLP
jgi:hypothetical protein